MTYCVGAGPVERYCASMISHSMLDGHSASSMPGSSRPADRTARVSSAACGRASSVTVSPVSVVSVAPLRSTSNTRPAYCSASDSASVPAYSATALLQSAACCDVVPGWYDASTAAPPQMFATGSFLRLAAGKPVTSAATGSVPARSGRPRLESPFSGLDDGVTATSLRCMTP